MAQHILPKGFQRIRYYGLHGNVRYKKSREQLDDILPTNMPDDQIGYRILPPKPFTQRFVESFGKNPLVCPKCGNKMSLELVYHPEYGILKEFSLFEELPNERRTDGTLAGNAVLRTKRLVQVSLPFL